MAHSPLHDAGGLLFSFFAAIYYWVPKIDGLRDQRAVGQDPLRVTMFLACSSSTFGLLLVHRLPLGHAAALGDVCRLSAGRQHLGLVSPAFVLGASTCSSSSATSSGRRCSPACAGWGESMGVEVDRVAVAPLRRCRCTTSIAFRRSGRIRTRTAVSDSSRGRGRRSSTAPARADTMTELAGHATDYSVVEREPPRG